MAVLELDEAHALRFTEHVKPTHSLLLNVARDQLDRFAEIDATAQLLARLSEQTTRGVVLNLDDSFVSADRDRIADGVEVRYFGVDASIADRLPELQEADVRFDDDFTAPEAGRRGRPAQAPRRAVLRGGVRRGRHRRPGRAPQRGLAAMINATAATTTARMLLRRGLRREAATVEALRTVQPPFGRGEVIDADGQPLELVLVKNPAGFTVALSTYGTTPVTSMVAINDNYADGRDVSWLYDVSFESLRERGVAMTSGVRAYDMALRLRYDDVAVDAIEPDLDPGPRPVPHRAPRRAQADLLHLHRDDDPAPRPRRALRARELRGGDPMSQGRSRSREPEVGRPRRGPRQGASTSCTSTRAR